MVFASSLAVFGGILPSTRSRRSWTITPCPIRSPATGTQKFIGEQLLADYTRKGFLRGRAVRLMTVTVRPGRPNAAASGFFSSIIREPLAGQRAVCPVGAGDRGGAHVAGPGDRWAALRGHLVRRGVGRQRAVTLPALTMTVADMIAALERAGGPEASALIDWVPDPEVARLVASWPARVRADRAERRALPRTRISTPSSGCTSPGPGNDGDGPARRRMSRPR